MFCPKCGKINPDSEDSCSGCGAPLKEEKPVIEPKKGKALKLAVTLLAVAVVVCVVVFLLNGCNAPGEEMTF